MISTFQHAIAFQKTPLKVFFILFNQFESLGILITTWVVGLPPLGLLASLTKTPRGAARLVPGACACAKSKAKAKGKGKKTLKGIRLYPHLSAGSYIVPSPSLFYPSKRRSTVTTDVDVDVGWPFNWQHWGHLFTNPR